MPLTYYSRAATREFWSEHWGGQDVEALLRVARRSPLTALIENALPRNGRILEAGCGLGQYVILLREHGYAAVGVDWSLEALKRCRKAAPTAAVAVMELRALAVRSGGVAAYLSLGVVEHDPLGPAEIVTEAKRVLAPGGILVLSVPYLNGARRLFRGFLSRAQAKIRDRGGEFYQYGFTRSEVRDVLEATGFRILSDTPYDPARVLRKAIRQLVGAHGSGAEASGPTADGTDRSLIRRLARALLYTPPLLRFLGHMILFVAVKR